MIMTVYFRVFVTTGFEIASQDRISAETHIRVLDRTLSHAKLELSLNLNAISVWNYSLVNGMSASSGSI